MSDAESRPELQRSFALEIVRRLRDAGYQSLWAGGSVRDLILGQTPADYDVATDATPEQVMAILPFRAITVGISFGVVRVRMPRQAGIEVEVSTFRSDGAYLDGRRPQSVVFSSPEMDAARRDFTINGMFLDPVSGEVIDYVGGHADLENRVLRAIGDPMARLREDKLRVLRAIRLAARFQFQIEPATLAALEAMAGQLDGVSAERIAQELRRMLTHRSRAQAMNLAYKTGVIASVLAPLTSLKGLSQCATSRHLEDAWDHTMRVLELLPFQPSFTLVFAALLHDVGKPAAAVFDQEGHPSFPGHETEGARTADRLCLSLKLSNTEREKITWLIAHHRDLVEARSMRESKLKRILAAPGIEELLALHRADALASTGDTEHVDYCEHYLKVQPDGPINPLPLITGHDLVRRGLEPGSQFATILEQVREAQLDRQIQSAREALEWIDQRLASGALLTRGNQPADGD